MPAQSSVLCTTCTPASNWRVGLTLHTRRQVGSGQEALPVRCPLTWQLSNRQARREGRCRATAAVAARVPTMTPELASRQWDAIVIGGGMGGLATATQLAAKGASVLLMEKYIIPGGSAGQFERQGYKFDVGSSMMFGLSDKPGSTNLITKALQAVGRSLETIPDPTQLEYHLPESPAHPDGLNIKVWCDYERFVEEVTSKFPHEAVGIRAFYDECWKIFNALNSMELKSLEEIRFLMSQFVKQPLSCLTLAANFVTNTGEVARRYIKDEELLRLIDIECYCWSTVLADMTPIINSGMVFCDRFYGGIRYPRGGVGRIAEELAAGLEDYGGTIVYKANVKQILTEGEGPDKRAVGVRLLDGTEVRARTVVSNATRWDTFGALLGTSEMPANEVKFRTRYHKAPSFLSLHLGVRADFLPADTECHHILVEDWTKMEDSRGTIFVSIPSLLDPSLAPSGMHTFHTFAPEWIEEYRGLSGEAYKAAKQRNADDIIDRLERRVFPGLRDAIAFQEVGTPRTHAKFLNREDGTYGPIPMRPPLGILNMPFNSTDIQGLYCVGDSTFPGQGVNAVVFSGFGCAHRVLVDLGKEGTWPVADKLFNSALRAARYNT